MDDAERRADELVKSWFGKMVSLNEHRAGIAAAIREACKAERERNIAAACRAVED